MLYYIYSILEHKTNSRPILEQSAFLFDFQRCITYKILIQNVRLKPDGVHLSDLIAD